MEPNYKAIEFVVGYLLVNKFECFSKTEMDLPGKKKKQDKVLE